MMRLAYLTSQYPATSHTFIRREVAALRQLGQAIETFSVRPPAQAELRSDVERLEADHTYTLLTRSAGEFALAHARELVARPLRYLTTLMLALRHRPPGLKAFFLSLAHFAESVLLAAELRRCRINHLHNHFANSGATVGFLASRMADIEWSFTIHGISEFDYPSGILLPEKILAANFVACVSYFGRAQAARLVDPTQWPKLQIVRCGLDLDEIPARVAGPADDVTLLFVGRLSAEKGVAGLLEAMSRMNIAPPPRLILVGDGPLRADLENQAKRLGLGDRVEFLGRLSEEETLLEMAKADVLVVPSFMEGLPIVIMESLALGVPVVASRVAGIPELVDDEETGLLFAPSHWEELAKALDRLAGDPPLRARFGKRGPARIAEEFDVRLSALKLLDLFATGGRSAAIPKGRRSAPSRNTSAPSTGRTRAG